jgi:hypothetical protein
VGAVAISFTKDLQLLHEILDLDEAEAARRNARG